MIRIEFDPAKDAANRAKHGVSLADARLVLAGDLIEQSDDRFSYGEDRFIAVGFLDVTMVILAYTFRDDVYRIISMRKCTPKERKHYGPHFAGD